MIGSSHCSKGKTNAKIINRMEIFYLKTYQQIFLGENLYYYQPNNIFEFVNSLYNIFFDKFKRFIKKRNIHYKKRKFIYFIQLYKVSLKVVPYVCKFLLRTKILTGNQVLVK